MRTAARSRLASIWNGLGIFSFALLLWMFLTPCNWQSPSLYLPPFLIGLWLGFGREEALFPWGWQLSAMATYALALAALAAAIVWLTGGPWQALYTANILAGLSLLPYPGKSGM